MNRIGVSLLLLALAQTAGAQTEEQRFRGQGNVQFGVGGCSVGAAGLRIGCGAVLQLTGGGEAFIYRGLSAGAEVGWGWLDDSFNAGLGLFSANPSYHFRSPGRLSRLVPFATGGYSMVFRERHIANGFNLGGGATWWAANRVGIRFEGRFHHFGAGPLGANLYVFRTGLSFR